MHATPRPGAPQAAARLLPSLAPADLARLLNEDPPVVIDGSWHMPATGRSGKGEYEAGPRIPGALFFDVDAIADPSSGLPHMLPSQAAFAAAADALGVASPEAPVVVYDGAGIFSAPRVWWAFRAMGHRK
jgi:thiosulfate/3-mercaptopyruvate sulfurtransferase